MTASARAMRQMLWRDAANRLILEEAEKAQANVENAGQSGPGKSEVRDLGREVAEAKVSVGD